MTWWNSTIFSPSLLVQMRDRKLKLLETVLQTVFITWAQKISSVLVSALQSFHQVQMNDGKEIVVELDDLLCSFEDDKGSLMRNITILDALLVSVRDRILSTSE